MKPLKFTAKAAIGLIGMLLAALLPLPALAAPPQTVRLDYAYYSPPSLVLKHFGWAEAAFGKDHVSWTLSAGSNRALEYLNSGSVDFASTAGLAAVLSRANGNPVKAVYVYSQPEWTALVVPKDSPIHSVRDLKGKTVAATKGTDAYLFVLRSLREAGLNKDDVRIVSLQHADGRAAMEQHRVDAWGGLDPLMAASQLEAGSKLIYRNVAFNTYGFLNTSDNFAASHPEIVRQVIGLYEKARLWIIAHPDDAAKLLSAEAKISLPVAKLQLSRNNFGQPIPGEVQLKALKSAAPILIEDELVRPGTDLGQVINALVDPRFARAVVQKP